MTEFRLPADLKFNRGKIHDPSGYAREAGVSSWLFLVGASARSGGAGSREAAFLVARPA